MWQILIWLLPLAGPGVTVEIDTTVASPTYVVSVGATTQAECDDVRLRLWQARDERAIAVCREAQP